MNTTIKLAAGIEADPEDFQQHQTNPNWYKAALNSRQADPFCCSPVWQLSFHNAYSPNRRLLIRESNNNVIAFAEKVFPLQATHPVSNVLAPVATPRRPGMQLVQSDFAPSPFAELQ